ncbi:MAG: sulfotransferase [Pseudomonadota bacterium]
MLDRALALHKQGQLDEAVAHYKSVLAATPDNHEAHHFLGMALHSQDKSAEAVTHIAKALELRPDYAQAALNLGRIHCATGARQEGGLAFDRALQINPHNPEILATNGVFAMEDGRDIDAVALFKKTLEIAPDYPEVRLHLAHLMMKLRHPGEAFKLANAVALQEPKNVQALSLKARALHRLDESAKADEVVDEVLKLAPQLPDAMVLRAQIAEEDGHFDVAREWYNMTLSKAERHPAALAGLIGLRGAGHLAQPHIQTAEALAKDQKLSDDLRRPLFHSLGKYYERSDDFDIAFERFLSANALVTPAEPYDPKATEQFISAQIDHFTEDFLAERQDWGLPDARPIFVVGMPRSGTTLTEQILSSHGEVAGAGEMAWIQNLAKALTNDAKKPHYSEAMALVTRENSTQLAEKYLKAQSATAKTDAASIVDKLPLNFLYIGLIRTLFPNAPIIYCKRDARDNCLSCFVEAFDDEYDFTANLSHLGHFYRQHDRLMTHWQEVTEVHLRPYEAVTSDFESTTRALIAACGLDWDDACLRYHETRTNVRTPSKWQVRQPIYKTSVGRWQRYERHLEPLVEALDA